MKSLWQWAQLQKKANKLIENVYLGGQLHADWLTSSHHCSPLNDHTGVRTALRHPLLNSGSLRKAENRSLLWWWAVWKMQILVLGFKSWANTHTHTYLVHYCSSWSRCGSPQQSTGFTELQTRQSSHQFNSTQRFDCFLSVWLEDINQLWPTGMF